MLNDIDYPWGFHTVVCSAKTEDNIGYTTIFIFFCMRFKPILKKDVRLEVRAVCICSHLLSKWYS